MFKSFTISPTQATKVRYRLNVPINDEPVTSPKDNTPKTNSNFINVIYVVILAALVGGIVGGMTTFLIYKATGIKTEIFRPNQSIIVEPTSSEIRAVVNKVEPSVVSIVASSANGSSNQGTGMVVGNGTFVLTNNHVIAGANQIEVTQYSSGNSFGATVVGSDSTDDLALLTLTNSPQLPAVTFAASKNVSVGEYVIAIGNALDLSGQPTVTSGIVSALGRTIPAGELSSGLEVTLTNMIQTDAPINSGNSGGPLLNLDGQVIGMNTAAATSTPGNAATQNIGFAIASNELQNQLPLLQAGKNITPGVNLGVVTSNLNATEKSYFGIESSLNYGALVEGVTPGSPAQQAGIHVGDVIIMIEQTRISNTSDLTSILQSIAPQGSIQVTIVRKTQQVQLQIGL